MKLHLKKIAVNATGNTTDSYEENCLSIYTILLFWGQNFELQENYDVVNRGAGGFKWLPLTYPSNPSPPLDILLQWTRGIQLYSLLLRNIILNLSSLKFISIVWYALYVSLTVNGEGEWRLGQMYILKGIFRNIPSTEPLLIS